MAKELKPAVAYLRTSSAANVGADKDSDKRQRAAIEAYAKRAGSPLLPSITTRPSAVLIASMTVPALGRCCST